jgi:hypothetical protein
MKTYIKHYLSSKRRLVALACLMLLVGMAAMPAPANGQVQNPQNGSTGLQGKISSPPPTTGATISLPRDGQSFNTLPVTVSGICPKGLLVKLFKNNVFAGSTDCTNGSFSVPIDLFNGRNELVARVYDALDQAGPDSNMVAVTFSDAKSVDVSRVSLTSNYAKRGANPGEALVWPIILAGGTGPYAISIDWGDGKAADLMSRAFPGAFDIKHTYDNPGVYNIIIKATDKNGAVAYLQLVGVGNGALSQDTGSGQAKSNDNNGTNTTTTTTRILWQPAAILLPIILLTFWLGKKHELKVLKKRVELGQRPF